MFYNYSGIVSKSFIGLAIVVSIYCGIKEIELFFAGEKLANGDAIYAEKYYFFWSLSYLLFFIGSFKTLMNLDKEKLAIKIQTFVGVLFIAMFLLIVVAVFGRSGAEISSGLATLTAGFVVFMSTGLGWLINTKNSHVKHKTSHTFKVLLDSRLSSTYQGKLIDLQKQYPPGEKIPSADVMKIIKNDSTLGDEKTKAINAAAYILDFYEFIAAGINSGDLDSDFLYENARGFACGMVEKSEYLINLRREDQPKVWIQLTKLINNWNEKYKNDPKK